MPRSGPPDDFAGGNTAPKAVIVGSGFGGLAAAIRLLARGFRVELLEALDQPGGRARVFRQNGYVFDAGPTIITAPFLFDELWSLMGKRFADDVKLVEMDPFYRIRFDDGTHFDYSGNGAEMRRQIAAISPDDVAGYDRFMAYSKDLYEVGFEQLCHVPIDTLPRMFKILPELIRLSFHRSVYGSASRFFRHEKLRKVFSFHPLLIGGNPFSTTGVYSMISYLEQTYGVHFAMGGTGALIKAMVNLITDAGGTIRYNSPVAEIQVERQQAVGVRLADGEEIRADIVVSNADVATTYSRLLPATVRRRWSPAKVKRQRYSMGLVVWYFGTDRKYDDIPHHMILLGPRYKALLNDIFNNKILADDFSLYLHRPTATDPGLAPAGGDSFYVLSPVPNLDADIDWNSEAEPYRRRIEKALEATLLPDLGKHIAASHMMTPLNFAAELGSYKGAGFSLAPHLIQSAWFRPHNRCSSIKGLYIVGAGTHPGAGIPGVVSTAKVLDMVVPDVTSRV